jgi:hypothetical protein
MKMPTTTVKGRVVYNRKKEFFTWRRILRIVTVLVVREPPFFELSLEDRNCVQRILKAVLLYRSTETEHDISTVKNAFIVFLSTIGVPDIIKEILEFMINLGINIDKELHGGKFKEKEL